MCGIGWCWWWVVGRHCPAFLARRETNKIRPPTRPLLHPSPPTLHSHHPISPSRCMSCRRRGRRPWGTRSPALRRCAARLFLTRTARGWGPRHPRRHLSRARRTGGGRRRRRGRRRWRRRAAAAAPQTAAAPVAPALGWCGGVVNPRADVCVVRVCVCASACVCACCPPRAGEAGKEAKRTEVLRLFFRFRSSTPRAAARSHTHTQSAWAQKDKHTHTQNVTHAKGAEKQGKTGQSVCLISLSKNTPQINTSSSVRAYRLTFPSHRPSSSGSRGHAGTRASIEPTKSVL